MRVAVVACVAWPLCEGTPTTNEVPAIKDKNNLPVKHKIGSATALAPGAEIKDLK